MSYNATFWTFAKKTNSTKQPTATGTVYTVDIMDGSGVLSPTIKLLTAGHVNPVALNYCQISAFGRYYFVSNWRYDRGLWWADLSVDVLASFKTEIGSTSSYIYRAYTGSTVSGYIDNNYPFTTYHQTRNAYPAANPFVSDISAGCFILGLAGQGDGLGGITYVAMDSTNYGILANKLFSNTNWLNISDISVNLQKGLINPLQYVQSVMWFPIAYANVPGTAGTTLHFAWWDFTGITFKTLNASGLGTVYAITFNITPVLHPAYSEYGNEMLLNPASTYTAICVPFGQWDIDPLNIVDADYIVFSMAIDLITGQAFLLTGSYEFDGDQHYTRWFDSRQGRLGVPMAINQNVQDVLGAASSVIGGAVGAVASGGAGAILAAAHGVTSAAERMVPKSSTSGGQGNTAFYHLMPRIISEHLMPSPRDATLYGTPVFETKTINSFSGFVQCNGNFSGSCLDPERDSINTYMEQGFFYE